MLSNKRRIMRTLAIVLILALVTPALLACSVVNKNPVVLKVGNVTMHLNDYVQIYGPKYLSNSSSLSGTKAEVDLQNEAFEELKENAVMLWWAKKNNIKLDDNDMAEIEDEINEGLEYMAEYYGYTDKVEKLDSVQLEKLGYPLAEADQEAVDAKLEELLKEDLQGYKGLANNGGDDETDASAEPETTEEAEATEPETAEPETTAEVETTEPDTTAEAETAEPNAEGEDNEGEATEDEAESTDDEALALLKADLEKEGKTYEDYLAEKEQEARVAVRNEDYAKKEAVSLYLKANGYDTYEKYRKTVIDSYKRTKLIEKAKKTIMEKCTLENAGINAKAWYDEQVQKLLEEYAEDTSGYYMAQDAYDNDPESMQPLVVPEGYIRVKHIYIQEPEEDEDEATESTEPAETEDLESTEPEETEATESTEPEETEALEDTPETTESTEPTEGTEGTEGTEEGEEAVETEKPESKVSKELLDEIQAAIDNIDPNADRLAAFDMLIEKYGEDPGMEAGSVYAEKGYLVSESIEDYYYDGFVAGALTLENVGDITEPIVTSKTDSNGNVTVLGVHFIQLVEKVAPKTVEFEDVQEAITDQLLTKAQETYLAKQLAEIIAKAPITEYRNRIRSYRPSF